MADDLAETISDAAKNPKRASVDGVDVEQQPISDLIKADQYLAAKKAVTQPTFGMRLGRFIPPGSV